MANSNSWQKDPHFRTTASPFPLPTGLNDSDAPPFAFPVGPTPQTIGSGTQFAILLSYLQSIQVLANTAMTSLLSASTAPAPSNPAAPNMPSRTAQVPPDNTAAAPRPVGDLRTQLNRARTNATAPPSKTTTSPPFKVWIGGFFAHGRDTAEIAAWIIDLFPGLIEVTHIGHGAVYAICRDQQTLDNTLKRNGTKEQFFPAGVKAELPHTSRGRAPATTDRDGWKTIPSRTRAAAAADAPQAASSGQRVPHTPAAAADASPSPRQQAPAAPAPNRWTQGPPRGQAPPLAAAAPTAHQSAGETPARRHPAGIAAAPAASRQPAPTAALDSPRHGAAPRSAIQATAAPTTAAGAVPITAPIRGGPSRLAQQDAAAAAGSSPNQRPPSPPKANPTPAASERGRPARRNSGRHTLPGSRPRCRSPTSSPDLEDPNSLTGYAAAVGSANTTEPENPGTGQGAADIPAAAGPTTVAAPPTGPAVPGDAAPHRSSSTPQAPPSDSRSSRSRTSSQQPTSGTDRSGRGGGADFPPLPISPPAHNPPSEADRNRIRQTHTQLPDSGAWVHGIKGWEAKQAQAQTQHTAIRVPGDGDCFYWTLIEHFKFIQTTGGTVPAVQELWPSAREWTVDQLKQHVDHYYLSDEFRRIRQLPEFNQVFLHLLLDDDLIPVEVADIEHHLATPHAYTPLAVCQLAALAFGLDLHLQCLLELEDGPQILHGCIPSASASTVPPSAFLLFREGGVQSYDQSFAPIGACEGHFWYVKRPELLPESGPTGDEAEISRNPASASPLPAAPGNGGASELLRR